MRTGFLLGIGCLLAALAGCGGDGGGDVGADLRGSGPNAGNGWLLVTNPASGAYQTDQPSIALAGSAFTPAGASCLPVASLPPGFQVSWSNNSTGAAGNASRGINCVGIVFVFWNAASIPLAMGVNSINVTVVDGMGNVGGDTIVVTRVPDTTPPTVVDIWLSRPGTGSSNIGLGTTVTFLFSEAMNPSTINTATITLTDGAGIAVPAAVIYDSVSLSATLMPSNPLAAGTMYQATVTMGVQDASGGNSLAAPFMFSFTTGSSL